MKIEIKYPDQEFYAIVAGVDISSISSTKFEELRKIVETYGIVAIKAQDIDDNQQITFSKKFGDLEISIGTNTKKENNPYILYP